jgi:ATP-dependent Clp protease, protease subunit
MTPPAINLPARPKWLKFDVSAVADPVFEVKALAEAATISVFDVIGLEVTASRIAGALRQIGHRPVTVQINSPGGDYYEGIAVYNLLRGHSQPVTVEVLGIAASAASIIAMAGGTIKIARNAEVMIHRAHSIALGDAETMAQAADFLTQIDAAMAATYAQRAGLPVAQVEAMMSAETYMPSAQAIDLGFADALLDRDAAPKMQSQRAGAQSKRDLEAQLRDRLGFSRSAAARGAAAAWAAISQEEPELDLDRVAAHVTAFTEKLRQLAA